MNEPTTPGAQVPRQYYYRVNGCEALNAHKASCVCWHDEGTGPRAGEQGLTWRTKPAPTVTDTLAAQQAVMQQALDALQALMSLTSREAPMLSGKVFGDAYVAIASLRAALSATKDEP